MRVKVGVGVRGGLGFQARVACGLVRVAFMSPLEGRRFMTPLVGVLGLNSNLSFWMPPRPTGLGGTLPLPPGLGGTLSERLAMVRASGQG